MLENQLQKTEKDSKKKDASLKKQLKSLKEENEKQQKIIQQVCTARDRKYWEYYCLNVFGIKLVDKPNFIWIFFYVRNTQVFGSSS